MGVRIVNLSLGKGKSPRDEISCETPIDEYKSLNRDQFIILSRLLIKDKLIETSSTFSSISDSQLEQINLFFESIPESLIDFSSNVSKKLLFKYIISNLKYGFKIKLTEFDNDIIVNAIIRCGKISGNIKD